MDFNVLFSLSWTTHFQWSSPSLPTGEMSHLGDVPTEVGVVGMPTSNKCFQSILGQMPASSTIHAINNQCFVTSINHTHHKTIRRHHHMTTNPLTNHYDINQMPVKQSNVSINPLTIYIIKQSDVFDINQSNDLSTNQIACM